MLERVSVLSEATAGEVRRPHPPRRRTPSPTPAAKEAGCRQARRSASASVCAVPPSLSDSCRIPFPFHFTTPCPAYPLPATRAPSWHPPPFPFPFPFPRLPQARNLTGVAASAAAAVGYQMVQAVASLVGSGQDTLSPRAEAAARRVVDAGVSSGAGDGMPVAVAQSALGITNRLFLAGAERAAMAAVATGGGGGGGGGGRRASGADDNDSGAWALAAVERLVAAVGAGLVPGGPAASLSSADAASGRMLSVSGSAA
jgi:hypothetical protein